MLFLRYLPLLLTLLVYGCSRVPDDLDVRRISVRLVAEYPEGNTRGIPEEVPDEADVFCFAQSGECLGREHVRVNGEVDFEIPQIAGMDIVLLAVANVDIPYCEGDLQVLSELENLTFNAASLPRGGLPVSVKKTVGVADGDAEIELVLERCVAALRVANALEGNPEISAIILSAWPANGYLLTDNTGAGSTGRTRVRPCFGKDTDYNLTPIENKWTVFVPENDSEAALTITFASGETREIILPCPENGWERNHIYNYTLAGTLESGVTILPKIRVIWGELEYGKFHNTGICIMDENENNLTDGYQLSSQYYASDGIPYRSVELELPENCNPYDLTYVFPDSELNAGIYNGYSNLLQDAIRIENRNNVTDIFLSGDFLPLSISYETDKPYRIYTRATNALSVTVYLDTKQICWDKEMQLDSYGRHFVEFNLPEGIYPGDKELKCTFWDDMRIIGNSYTNKSGLFECEIEGRPFYVFCVD